MLALDQASRIRGLKDRHGAVWQPRYWEHLIRDENDWRRHADYLHYNPVKHGYVIRPEDWPYSTYRKFVSKGWYELGWGHAMPREIEDMDFE